MFGGRAYRQHSQPPWPIFPPGLAGEGQRTTAPGRRGRWRWFAVAGDGLHGLETTPNVAQGPSATVHGSRDFPKGWVTKESGLWPDS